MRTVFAATCLLLPMLASAQSYLVDFPEASYISIAGTPFNAPITIAPVPASGLFSYGVVVEVVGSSGLTGVVFVQPANALDFDGPRGTGIQRDDDPGVGRGKGTVDIFNTAKPNHIAGIFAQLNITGLPEGSYTLQLAPYNTLGNTEDLFVDGAGQTLDPFITFGNATLTVQPGVVTATVVASGDLRTDRQTGMLLRDYVLTNTGTRASAFRVWIRNLASNWQVWNRHGIVDAVPYVDITQLVPAGQSVTFTLEFYASPRVGTPDPTLDAVGITAAPPIVEGTTSSLAPRATLNGGDVLLEFATESGKNYTIQYSSDLVNWNSVLPKIQGTGSRVQWIDNGPPKTPIRPVSAGARFYRMVAE
ncbi:MAG: hypothetical protein IPK32_23155 [Verrucomicrobiaceae bacterium]|nr:hypothetical protein [Verrucomicrobiaceae bacterium]